MFFLGLMLILRTLLDAIPKWKIRKEQKKRNRGNDE